MKIEERYVQAHKRPRSVNGSKRFAFKSSMLASETLFSPEFLLDLYLVILLRTEKKSKEKMSKKKAAAMAAMAREDEPLTGEGGVSNTVESKTGGTRIGKIKI
jgi:hypothetical protein